MQSLGNSRWILLPTILVLIVINLCHVSDASKAEVSRRGYARQLLILCTANGFMPYPDDTTKYIQCVWIRPRWYYYVYNCPPGSNFDPARSLCVISATAAPPATTPAATTTAATTPTGPVTTTGTVGPTTTAGSETTLVTTSGTEAPTTVEATTTV